ncbi:MAG: hypothetical protein QW369_03120 [Desulfurococcaceae archaeon]
MKNINVKLDEATSKALVELSSRTGIDPESIAKDVLRAFIQYLSYYIVRTDVITTCGDIIPPKYISMSKTERVNVAREIVKRNVIKPASIIVKLQAVLGEVPRKIDLAELSSIAGVKLRELRSIVRKLVEANVARIDGDTLMFDLPEAAEKFAECAERLEKQYGLKTIMRARTR